MAVEIPKFPPQPKIDIAIFSLRPVELPPIPTRKRYIPPPFKGPHSEETKLRMGEAHAGKKRNFSPQTTERLREHMLKLRATHPGFIRFRSSPRSKEHGNNIGNAIEALWQTDGYRQKVRDGLKGNQNFKGKKHSPETKQKIKDAIKRIRADSEDKRKRGEARIHKEAQSPDIERQIWNYAKRSGFLKIMIDKEIFTHQQLGLLKKYFGLGRIEISTELIEKFTKAVANLA